jgi:hypothetical protein
MRYTSVLSTNAEEPKARRRFGFLPCSRWRLPAWERITLPVPVTLNRFATDFFVLIPFGRRIYSVLKRVRNIGEHRRNAQALIWLFCFHCSRWILS